jgi:hypothetical protein
MLPADAHLEMEDRTCQGDRTKARSRSERRAPVIKALLDDDDFRACTRDLIFGSIHDASSAQGSPG